MIWEAFLLVKSTPENLGRLDHGKAFKSHVFEFFSFLVHMLRHSGRKIHKNGQIGGDTMG